MPVSSYGDLAQYLLWTIPLYGALGLLAFNLQKQQIISETFNVTEGAKIEVLVRTQSPDISQGVTAGQGFHEEQGAGDQGLMFGFATNETPELMPLPIMLSHKLLLSLSAKRHEGILPYLRPDSKSQVTVEYEDGIPKRIDTIVISTQHSPDVTLEEIREDLVSSVIRPEDNNMIDKETIIHITLQESLRLAVLLVMLG